MKRMRFWKRFYAAVALLFVLPAVSCTKQQTPGLTQTEIKAKVDSIVASRADDLSRQNDENLSYRVTVEVKQKADSIVAARLGTTPAPAPPQR